MSQKAPIALGISEELIDLASKTTLHEGLALVKELKGRIQQLCIKNGASHFQVGKDYPYLATRKPAVREVVGGLKRLLDPQNLMNPGALGLD